MSFIQIESLSKRYDGGVLALDSVSLGIEKGEFVCILGGSGCGKSTLLNLVAGFERPSDGRVVIGGEEVKRPSKDRQMIFQNYGLFPWRTVEGNVAFALKDVRHLSADEKKRKVEEALATVGLEAFSASFPHQLSGGMRQRVAVARTLAAEPKVVFMDEPFGALDAITKMKLQDEVRKIVSDGERTVLMITHDIDEAIYLADRILVMKPGPGRVFKDVKVSFSFPRQRTAPDFLYLRSQLLEYLDLAVNLEADYVI